MPADAPHTSTLHSNSRHEGASGLGAMTPALVLVWSKEEPARVGEAVVLPQATIGVPFAMGRATEPADDGALPLGLSQLRPFSRVETGPLRGSRVSRWQLRIRATAEDELQVEHVGRGELTVNGEVVTRAVVHSGDLLAVRGRFALLVAPRPADWPRGTAWYPSFPFGAADDHGIVGESPAAWELRRQLVFLARLHDHVLVHGPSGSGKELVVRALHRLSPRAGAPLIARNVATIPDALVSAELFGKVLDLPHPGMPDGSGMLARAHGGTLYLDELSEVSQAFQAHLLRVMDGGEYQPLGEPRGRVADVRIIAATNRDPAELKHGLLARFIHRIRVPGLGERRDDVPLLAHHLLRKVAGDAEQRLRFFGGEEPRLSSELIAALLGRPFVAHTRQLLEILWRAIAASASPELVVPPGEPAPASRAVASVEPGELTREQVLAALETCDGVREKAWRVLGLRSRDQLKRLLKKFEIV
jgi:two-component system nitrogen regulation response regulator GlnG/two-component system response regulator HydG